MRQRMVSMKVYCMWKICFLRPITNRLSFVACDKNHAVFSALNAVLPHIGIPDMRPYFPLMPFTAE